MSLAHQCFWACLQMIQQTSLVSQICGISASSQGAGHSSFVLVSYIISANKNQISGRSALKALGEKVPACVCNSQVLLLSLVYAEFIKGNPLNMAFLSFLLSFFFSHKTELTSRSFSRTWSFPDWGERHGSSLESNGIHQCIVICMYVKDEDWYQIYPIQQ